MKRLTNADLRVLLIRKQWLKSLINDLPTQHIYDHEARVYAARLNVVRTQIGQIVDDPEFDGLVNVAVLPEEESAPYVCDPGAVRMIANELLSYLDVTLADYEYPIAKVRALQRLQGAQGNVFIAHGSNEVVRHRVKDFIAERCGLKPIILRELPSSGMTVIEKLEKYGRTADYAIMILTCDDIVADGEVRARQNVIQELGWFQGVLGRDRTAILLQSGVEWPSNITGIVYLEFTGNDVELIFEDLRKELEAAGLM
ncbi:MAG: nucleotide-binding protein [Chloroflexi bacterium]|nr:nucleotide-binding protein [Chloroflexota bacterium]